MPERCHEVRVVAVVDYGSVVEWCVEIWWGVKRVLSGTAFMNRWSVDRRAVNDPCVSSNWGVAEWVG